MAQWNNECLGAFEHVRNGCACWFCVLWCRSFEDIGRSFTFTAKLTASEATALEASKPRARDQEDQDELYPLPAAQRVRAAPSSVERTKRRIIS